VQAFQKCRKHASQGSQQRLTSSQKRSVDDAENPILTADGKAGQQPREWLNMSFQDKAEMLAQVLKSCRESPTRRYQKYVWVNIPQFTLEYRNEGKIQAVHRVIVGKASGKKIKLNGRTVGENQTPTLASSIEQVVINPKWYVTERIHLELAGAIAADPSFLARNGYTYTTSGSYPSGGPRLIQLPGPNNSLGRIRFDFPNAYAVYMHDTPSKHLFQRARRDFSHGCIRVERAHELAKELLAGDQNPAASKTDSFLSTNRETFLRLREPVPIIIEYLPIVVNAKGDLVFCGDPYGWFRENFNRKS
jgi:murein L,D-transpeptidase YcbB/YkuD